MGVHDAPHLLPLDVVLDAPQEGVEAVGGVAGPHAAGESETDVEVECGSLSQTNIRELRDLFLHSCHLFS